MLMFHRIISQKFKDCRFNAAVLFVLYIAINAENAPYNFTLAYLPC